MESDTTPSGQAVDALAALEARTPRTTVRWTQAIAEDPDSERLLTSSGYDLRLEVLAMDSDSAELNDPTTMLLQISMAGGIREPCSNRGNVTSARERRE
ncbi:hypothetical protein HPB52_019980 [Rhipicephalus sanguineus]|uniref:Uncharacterized protein n=1 Tax=Rhipicephalus sanguineus TaxID=34632 RepID=A0A9D4T7X3_RHISA|nr:hypothetical protein HPB52_019980 [Rhipicephalus sanguineus]